MVLRKCRQKISVVAFRSFCLDEKESIIEVMGQFWKLTYCFHLMMASQPKVNIEKKKQSHITV